MLLVSNSLWHLLNLSTGHSLTAFIKLILNSGSLEGRANTQCCHKDKVHGISPKYSDAKAVLRTEIRKEMALRTYEV